ncbi:hypothetical protein [Streptomyces sp. CB03238]|uniref:hypothetical protein n=1 Tax=Streptomyces sp. CB03238 TaxID=1907777 RepID=UPI00117C0363|nr:hypothetical protein [Streptomyces sp. CB03238]
MVEFGDVQRMAKALRVEMTDDVAHGVITVNLPTEQHVRDGLLNERQLRIALDTVDAIETALRIAEDDAR